MQIAPIIATKGSTVHTIASHCTLLEVVDELLSRRVSSLIVVDPTSDVAGIVTEHDIIRTLKRLPTDWQVTRVEEVMTRDLFVAHPDDELAKIIETMTARHIRHLPVMNDGRLLGVLSIRDLIKASMSELARHNEMMMRYIRDWPEERKGEA
jgi:CBS domain-containing protein